MPREMKAKEEDYFSVTRHHSTRSTNPEGLTVPGRRPRATTTGSNSGGSTLLNEMPTRGQSNRTATNEKTRGDSVVRFQDVPLNNRPAVPDSGEDEKKKGRGVIEDIRFTCWHVVTYSWVNVLLVSVPAGIAVAQFPQVHGGIVFAINCVAVIPLAGLLAHATECLASEIGDAFGALLNVTFGNAVELIIFIALEKNKIRVVQASLLGSILANLLLILGMGFFLGGMRYQEQLYNSTVTQMSACLLSLSVVSLVLPTAFHASFSNYHMADVQSLKISRGTSVILLLVYIIFLVFQLKSHSYMYESMPRGIVDAEAAPGPAAAWLEADEAEGDSSGSESESSQRSRDTVGRRMRRALKPGRSRKGSPYPTGSEMFGRVRSLSGSGTNTRCGTQDDGVADVPTSSRSLHQFNSGETLNEIARQDHARHQRRRKRRSSRGMNGRKSHEKDDSKPLERKHSVVGEHPPRLELSYPNLASISREDIGVAPLVSMSPFTRFRNFTPVLFPSRTETALMDDTRVTPGGPATPGHKRARSMPDRMANQRARPRPQMMPSQLSVRTMVGGKGTLTSHVREGDEEESEKKLSRWASIIVLLATTGIVALCAEFLVSSIEDVTESTTIGETFIGLILLPIVGNAAEHITAVTVAMKNKMDLAIGVAIGSSIQIALFLTPLVVILGWIMDKQMSLYFTLFETVCLFVSAFIVNFLVLDGRSNYMEGALLCAVYLIISVVAFFYPSDGDTSAWGTGEEISGSS